MGKNFFIWFSVYLRYNVILRCHMHVYIYMTKSLVWSCEKMIHAINNSIPTTLSYIYIHAYDKVVGMEL